MVLYLIPKTLSIPQSGLPTVTAILKSGRYALVLVTRDNNTINSMLV